MNILVVDDEKNIQKTMSVALDSMGHATVSAYSVKQAMENLREKPIDVVFLDVKLGEEDGLEVLRQMGKDGFDQPVVVFTAYSTIETAVEATRRGAFDYVPKPFVPEQIRQMLKRIESESDLKQRVASLENRLAAERPAFIGRSNEPRMSELLDTAMKAAKADATMLLLGPSGTGKTMLAQAIHENSQRSRAPFVTVHCPSLSKELLESELFGHIKGSFTGAVKDTWGKVSAAEGGTLFLDEIGDLPAGLQAKLLRLLQERAYERIGETKTRLADVRVIAATNKDIKAEVDKGVIREDLYYRLNVISLTMPALNERRSDLRNLAEMFLGFHAGRVGKPQLRLSDEAMERIMVYDWPGNLRELSNVIERCVILSDNDEIEASDLPENISGESSGNGALRVGDLVSLEALEEEHIKRIVEQTESLEKAAEVLQIDTATLYRKRKKMGMLQQAERGKS